VPKTGAVLYREVDGTCPFVDRFDELPAKIRKRFEANPSRHAYEEV
jgi:hypothetical protein